MRKDIFGMERESQPSEEPLGSDPKLIGDIEHYLVRNLLHSNLLGGNQSISQGPNSEPGLQRSPESPGSEGPDLHEDVVEYWRECLKEDVRLVLRHFVISQREWEQQHDESV